MTMERQWVVGVDATEILPAPANAIGEFTASLSRLADRQDVRPDDPQARRRTRDAVRAPHAQLRRRG